LLNDGAVTAPAEHTITEQLKKLLAVPEACVVFRTSLGKLRQAAPLGGYGRGFRVCVLVPDVDAR
jgi:hypothetical protein